MSFLSIYPPGQETCVEFDAFFQPPLFDGGQLEETPVIEQHRVQLDHLAQFYIKGQPLYQFLLSHALNGHPIPFSGHDIDYHHQHHDTPIHGDSWFYLSYQELFEFLKRGAFIEQPPFSGGNETPAEQNGMPSLSASWMVPSAKLYQFLQRYAHPASESPPSGSGHEIHVEQNGTPDYTPLLLIPGGCLNRFLQEHVIPESLLSSDQNETLPEQLLDDISEDDTMPDYTSEDDAMPVSVTPPQDSDQVNDQPDQARDSFGCTVCNRLFNRQQERNRHIETYLPHSILCPSSVCTWTGRRQSDFQEHWKRKHPTEVGKVPGREMNELYNPKDFVKLIRDGMPVKEVARSAFVKVQEGLERLAKTEGAKVLGRNKNLKDWICVSSSQLDSTAAFDTNL